MLTIQRIGTWNANLDGRFDHPKSIDIQWIIETTYQSLSNIKLAHFISVTGVNRSFKIANISYIYSQKENLKRLLKHTEGALGSTRDCHQIRKEPMYVAS